MGALLTVTSQNVLEAGFTLTNLDSGNCWVMNSGAMGLPISLNTWYFAAFTFNGFSGTLYVNGALSRQVTLTTTLDTLWANAGEIIGGGAYAGSITNVQLYNTSLDANTIKALYKEGIGGAPINTQNLIGWWPLNGDANDYSGNNNNGAPTSISYISSWLNGYTHP